MQRSVRSLILPLGLAAATLAPVARAGGELHVPSQFATIQAAIDAAAPGDVVVVANGVYTGDGNRDLSFGGKAITVRSAGGAERCTIDCGSAPGAPYRAFLFENGETREAVVEGFTIINGDTPPGAISDPFNGGGIRILDCSPTIRGCVFRDNNAACWGGGVYAGSGGSPLIEQCVFDNNTADDGGGFFSWLGSVAEIRNSLFVGNTALASGGAVAEFGGGGLDLEHCTFTGNKALFGVIVNFGTGLRLHHSIVWNNGELDSFHSRSGTDVAFSNVQGGAAGPGNIDVDPRFSAVGFSLRASSPCIDAGDAGARPGGVALGGQPRCLDGDLDGAMRVDMGAYEFGNAHVDAGVLTGTVPSAWVLTSAPGNLTSFLIVGIGGNGPLLEPYGQVMLDLSGPLLVAASGPAPLYSQLPLAGLPSGFELTLQALAGAGAVGNLSNAVRVTVP